MNEFTLEPHSDGFMCQTFENPFDGDVRITGWEFQSGSGSAHHLIVFPEPNGTNTPAAECQMRAVDQIVIGSQASNDLVSYPDGVGTDVGASTGLVMRIHFDNRADTPEAVQGPRLKLRYDVPANSPRPTGLYAFTATDIDVAPGQAGAATSTVLAPEDMELVWMVSHYHDHGVSFTATVRDELVYTAGDVTTPPMTRVFDPPLLVRKGEPITFRCNYQASPDQGLRFGPSLKNDEMCNIKGGYLRTDGQPAAPMVEGGTAACLPPGLVPPPGRPAAAPGLPACPDPGSG